MEVEPKRDGTVDAAPVLVPNEKAMVIEASGFCEFKGIFFSFFFANKNS